LSYFHLGVNHLFLPLLREATVDLRHFSMYEGGFHRVEPCKSVVLYK
jgi:hypothetical protein